MKNEIVVIIDSTQESYETFKYAVALCEAQHKALKIVYVARKDTFFTNWTTVAPYFIVATPLDLTPYRNRCASLLQKAKDEAEAHGILVEVELLVGPSKNYIRNIQHDMYEAIFVPKHKVKHAHHLGNDTPVFVMS